MDERFGEWLRDALADVDDDLLKRRWSGVETLVESLDVREIMDLVLYGTACRKYNGETIRKVRLAFWEHDNAFRMEGNDLELQRLCGAVVTRVLHGDSEHRMDIALACSCLKFGGTYDGFGSPAMSEEADKILQGLSVTTRSQDNLKKIAQRVIAPVRLLANVKQLIDQGHETIPITELSEILSETAKGLNRVARENVALHRALNIQKEETDILWWLVGAYSNDLKVPFETLDGPIAAIVAGKELADHVRRRPGPLSVANILRRMIRKSAGHTAAISLEALITRIPLSWRSNLVAETDEEALPYCPLLAAMAHSVSLEDDRSWVTPFRQHFPHSTELDISPEVLAYQMYCERVLAVGLEDWR